MVKGYVRARRMPQSLLGGKEIYLGLGNPAEDQQQPQMLRASRRTRLEWPNLKPTSQYVSTRGSEIRSCSNFRFSVVGVESKALGLGSAIVFESG